MWFKAIFVISCLLSLSHSVVAQQDIRFSAPQDPSISVTGGYTWISQDFDVTSFNITGITPLVPLPPALLPNPALFHPGLITAVENEYSTYSLKVDSWLYPFLNVYGAIGQVKGQGKVTVGAPFDTQVALGYEGFIYGGGINLVVGWKNYFLLNNVAYSITDMEAGDTVKTFNWRPKVGAKLGDLVLYAGPTYQEIDRTQFGTATLPGLPIALDYSLGTEVADNWNFEIGGRYNLNEDWSVTLEGGFASRKKAVVSVTRHF